MSFTFTGLLPSSHNNNNSLLRSDGGFGVAPFCSDFPPGFTPAELLNASLFFSSSPNGFNWRNSSSEDQQLEKEDEKNYSRDPSFETQTENASLFQSSSSMFQELEPMKNQDTLKINEPAKQSDFSLERAATKFEYPITQNFSLELALTKPETHGNSAPGCSNVDYTNTSHPNGEQKGSGDGYNWRKYGEKQMKGGVNPRSYYKCTHPNCSMKKKVEKTSEGHTEIVYKGSHNHPKPEFTRRTSAQPTLQASSPGTNSGNSNQSVGEEDFELASPTSYPGVDADELGPMAKRKKGENENGDHSYPASRRRTVKEPRVVVQTTSEIDILDDGYKWRKYGQKVVKGNPNPRSYYKCVTPGCSVRKHIERAADDVKAVLTTYEGKHNHELPEGRGSTSHNSSMMMNNITSLNNNSSNVTAPIPIRPSAVTNSSGSTNFTNSLYDNTLSLWSGGIENFGGSPFGRSLIDCSYTGQEQNSLAAYSATDKAKEESFLKSFLS